MKMNSKVLKLMIAIVVLGFSACSNNNTDEVLPANLVKNPATASEVKEQVKMPKMVFEQKEQDFGTIVQGTSVTKIYTFTNQGDADLIISSASASCGCTVPSWPKRPIKPGESGEIEVIFNSQGKVNKQNKKIYITANTKPANNVIVLKGNVVAPE